jgi:hypothetical protein
MRVAGSLPRVVVTHAERHVAERERAALGEAGVRAVVIDCEAIEREHERFAVRQFGFSPTGLQLRAADGQELEVAYAQITALVRGYAVERAVATTVTKQRKFSATRALVSGGLVTSKKVEKRTTTKTETRSEFVFVYAPPEPTLALYKSSLDFSGLGQAMQPSGAANFARLVAELRARAPAAGYEEQLASHAGQAHVLGGTLDVASHLDLAAALVAYALRGPIPMA